LKSRSRPQPVGKKKKSVTGSSRRKDIMRVSIVDGKIKTSRIQFPKPVSIVHILQGKQLPGNTQAKKERGKIKLLASTYSLMYVHNPWMKTSNKSAAVYIGELPKLHGQPEENILTTLSSSTSSTSASHARGLVIAHSRKLLATLGGSTSTRPGVRKITLKTCEFIDISNATIPTTFGGSTTTSPPIVVVILRQQLDYVIIIYTAPTTPHPKKAKFSSSKNRLLFTFATPDPRGLRHEKSSCISLALKNCESPSSWRSLSNT
jgi:hypothetical protein